MKLIRNIALIKNEIKKAKKKNRKIGLVPTMGYLHDGHISLIKRAARECDYVVLSIFINPSQFGPSEDYLRYPKNIKRDLGIAKKAKVDIVFAPSAKIMYKNGHQTCVSVEKLGTCLCGIKRPAHFKGVATVVSKLFNIIEPDIAYFGQKDAQQAIIIDTMVKDLNMPIKLKILPIVREKDGLAMSSRNIYLRKADRANAIILYKSLQQAKRMIASGVKNANTIIHTIRKVIKSTPRAKIDYISILSSKDLEPVKRLKGKILIALAVYFGKTRLIDNIIITI